ncbi:MAG TPA: glutamine--fructose-6-phosphate aminotransferase [Ruminiclostridium sp.]|nr:glutamine--fructose-6-phosphate aminotransferase [Ruminiclostridium sp.]
MTHMWQEIMDQPGVLRNALEQNYKTIEDLVALLKEKKIRHVVIAARGTSHHAAVYAKYTIEIKLGIPVLLAAPSVFTMYHQKPDMKDSLVIGISQSGRAQDVLEVVKSAREQGALTATVTNFTDSPLAQEASFHLFCASGVEKSVAATKTFMAQIYLLAQLVAFWADDEEFKKELSEVPGLLEQTLGEAGQIQQAATRYRFMNECFVLARGVNYSIALESALKIQETTYVRAKAYATSDFHHGPFAMIENNMPVIIYAPKGPSLADTMEMIGKLKSAGADILTISSDPGVIAMGDCSITTPDSASDFITPFINTAIGQMFACDLALLKGLSPDTPRGLTKITITR